jgi:hypothetical protein
MFGRKKKKDDKKESKNVEEMEKIKEQVTGEPKTSQVVPTQATTPYFIGQKVTINRPQEVVTASGQVVKTGQVETVEQVEIISQLSPNDLIDIASNCKGNVQRIVLGILTKKLM